MLMKILGLQRAWEGLRGELPKPRQIFVTQSPKLAKTVKDVYHKMFMSLASQGMHSYRDEHPDGQRRREDGPQRWGDLNEEDFPLFITFDLVGVL